MLQSISGLTMRAVQGTKDNPPQPGRAARKKAGVPRFVNRANITDAPVTGTTREVNLWSFNLSGDAERVTAQPDPPRSALSAANWLHHNVLVWNNSNEYSEEVKRGRD